MRLSRRRLIKGSVLLVVGGAPDCAECGLLDGPKVKALKKRRAYLITKCERLDRLWLEAQARMPSHWRPGPKFMNEWGEMSGPLEGWPAEPSDPIKLRNGLWLVRPSPRDLRELFEEDVIEVGREAAIVTYRTRIRQLRDRLRARRRWESEVGMPRTADWRPWDIEIDSIDAQLQSLLGKTA